VLIEKIAGCIDLTNGWVAGWPTTGIFSFTAQFNKRCAGEAELLLGCAHHGVSIPEGGLMSPANENSPPARTAFVTGFVTGFPQKKLGKMRFVTVSRVKGGYIPPPRA
jgi:hypothetical protein